MIHLVQRIKTRLCNVAIHLPLSPIGPKTPVKIQVVEFTPYIHYDLKVLDETWFIFEKTLCLVKTIAKVLGKTLFEFH
jgi:hypothetical protein